MRLGDVAYWRGAFARRLWWLVVSTPVIIAGVLVTIRDGFLPPEYRNVYFFQYLSLRWYWHWYVIGLLLYLVLVLFFLAPATTRAALRKQKQRHRESFRRYRERSVRAPQIIYRDRPEPPNLQFSVNVKRVFRDKTGVIHEQDAGSHAESGFYAVTCAIENGLMAERKVGDVSELSASILFRSFTYDDGLTIDRGAWLGSSSSKVHLAKNQTQELIVATNERDDLFAIRFPISPIEGRMSTRISMASFLFPAHVQVTLFSDTDGSEVAQPCFVLDRHRYVNEADLILAPLAEWRHERLSMFFSEGGSLFHEAFDLPVQLDQNARQVAKRIKDAFDIWVEDVGKFLDQYWDTAHEERFLAQTVLRGQALEWAATNYIASFEPTIHVRRILSKMYVLSKFLDELQAEMSRMKSQTDLRPSRFR